MRFHNSINADEADFTAAPTGFCAALGLSFVPVAGMLEHWVAGWSVVADRVEPVPQPAKWSGSRFCLATSPEPKVVLLGGKQ